jgi:hypothetical protein
MSSSINQSMIDQFSSFEQSMTEQLSAMRKTLGLGEIPLTQTVTKTKTKKTSAKKAEKAEKAVKAEGSATEPKAPTAWNALVAQTVADMKQSGWPAWTDLKGVSWPASRSGTIKSKSGVESEAFVYDGGDHNGKPPSPALGGMVRASYLKAQSDPEAMAKAKAYHSKLEEKRSASGSVGSAEKEAPVADEVVTEAKPKKAGRPKMTAEQKAEKKAEKAEKVVPAVEETFTEPVPVAATPVTAKPVKKTIIPAKKKVDLSFYAWEHNSKKYIKNDRGDVIEPEEGCWVGRFDGKTIDESVEEPSDLDGVTMRE